MKFYKTRFDDGGQRLFYAHETGTAIGGGLKKPVKVDHWRFFHQDGNEEPRPVGAYYASRHELLADADRYGKEWGFA